MKRIIFSVCSIMIVQLISFAQTEKKWIEDIDYYQKNLEINHLNLFHTISKEEFNTEISQLKSKVHNLTEFQIIVELMRLTQKVGGGKGDGHTSVPLWNRKLKKYPLILYNFEGKLRVIKTNKQHQQLLGKQLISIDDTPIADILKKVLELSPFTENIYSSMDRSCSYMMISEILKAIGVTNDIAHAKFTFVDEKGVKESVVLFSYDKESMPDFDVEYPKNLTLNIIKPADSKLKKLWFTSANHNKTVYISFKEYPSEKEMNDFAESVYNFIEINKSKSLIVDLRDNYGGDYFIGLILISWLSASDFINWESNAYVLINRRTYSAAMVNAGQFKQLLNATVVGEPSGANPNGYQDMGQFTLPNSNLLISYSKKLIRLQDTNSAGIRPDILIETKWEDYKNGIDKPLEQILIELKD